MMDVLAQNISPYYNDYDRSKEFLQILFKPGSRVQARELTQLQSILQKQIATLAEYLLDNGNVVEGVGVSVVTDTFYRIDNSVNSVPVDLANLDNGTYTTNLGNPVEVFGNDVNDFIIYTDVANLVGGEFFTTNVGDIVISNGVNFSQGSAYRVVVGSGTYFVSDRFITIDAEDFYPIASGIATITGKVGFVYEEEFLSAKDDNSLNDPAKGTYGYSGSGADRLKLNTTLTFFNDGETIPDNFLPIVCFDNGTFDIVVNTAFMDGPNFTNVSLEHVNGKWNLVVSGNENAGNYELNLCDAPAADADELTRFLETNGPVLFLDVDGTECCLRKTRIGNIIPVQVHAICSGSEPSGVAVGGYWLDNSDTPPILRRRIDAVTWENVDLSNYFRNFTVKCFNTDTEYNLIQDELILATGFNICTLPEIDTDLLDGTEQYAVCFQDQMYRVSRNVSFNNSLIYIPTEIIGTASTTTLVTPLTSETFTMIKDGVVVINLGHTVSAGSMNEPEPQFATATLAVNTGDIIEFRHATGDLFEAYLNGVLVAWVNPVVGSGSSQSQIIAAPSGVTLLSGNVIGANVATPVTTDTFMHYVVYCPL